MLSLAARGPCTTEQKYRAKQAIDSFFVRMGDVGAAAVVFLGTPWLTLETLGFALLNGLFLVVWIALAWRIGRDHHALSVSGQPPVTVA